MRAIADKIMQGALCLVLLGMLLILDWMSVSSRTQRLDAEMGANLLQQGLDQLYVTRPWPFPCTSALLLLLLLGSLALCRRNRLRKEDVARRQLLILDFSKIESGRVEVEKIAFDLRGKIGIASEEGKGSLLWFTAALEKRQEMAKPVRALSELVKISSLGQHDDGPGQQQFYSHAFQTKPVRCSELHDCLVTVLGAGGGEAMHLTPRQRSTVAALGDQQRTGFRILLAEDCPVSQQVGLVMLGKLGFCADAVSNGLEAIKALEMFPYSLVLMDVQMPEMDGFEATKAIRSGKMKVANSRVPIIAMTANALQGDRTHCLEAGMDDYLSKPISCQGLARVLEQWLVGMPGEPTIPPDLPTQEGDAVSESAIFNFDLLWDRFGMNDEVARRSLTSFLQSLPVVLKELKGQIAMNDADAAWRLAHRIKGTAAMVTGTALSVVAFAMEKAGKAGDLEALNTLLPELERQFVLLQEAIERGGGAWLGQGLPLPRQRNRL